MPYQGLALLSELETEDLQWILNAGVEQQVIINSVVIQEGSQLDALYIVLEGLVGVFVSSLNDQKVGALGPGEVIGEASFLLNQPASATVSAVENSLLLALPHTILRERLDASPAFAARFYRSLAVYAARRMSSGVSAVSRLWNDRMQADAAANETWGQINEHLNQFKQLLTAADQEALKNDGVVPAETAERFKVGFHQFALMMNELIGDQAEGNPYYKQELGARIQREILPYLLLTGIAERIYSKPRGYAGDFLTIEMMYRDIPKTGSRLGPLIDACFMEEPAARAVRNRRGLLCDEIQKAFARSEDGTLSVTSLASGPAAELFDVFESLDDPTKLNATLIDIDLQALAFVGDKRDKLKLSRQMTMINGNLVYLATGRQQAVIKPQDLVYSIGLIDYFNDKFVTMLLNYVHGLLKPGGKVILGNFHPRNTSKALMDHVLDWKLIHRTEEDMDRLFQGSAFGRPCAEIRFEEAGVNLFAACVK